MKDAETRLSITKAILENTELHRTLDSYKNAPDAEVAYLEGIITSIWVATHTK